MVSQLISHTTKRLARSASFSKEMATQIFLGVIFLMIAVYTLALGFALNHIVTDVLHEADAVGFVCGLMLYYFASEFMMRYFLQNLPVLDVQPYLHLPVPRKELVHLLLGKSLLHGVNLLVLMLFAPFALTVVQSQYGVAAGWLWLLSLWLVSLSMGNLVTLFKKKLDDSIWGLLVLVAFWGGLAAADYFGWFKLSDVSRALFRPLIGNPEGVLIPVLIFAATYAANFYYFLRGFYPDDLAPNQTQHYGHRDWHFLRSLGPSGEWINLEMKLILRNKRPRTILMISSFFLLYGLFFYSKPSYQEQPGFMLFVGIFVTGIFMINYGQYLFSWQGAHFDFTLSRPVSLRQFIESKYLLLAVVTVLCFLLTMPYALFGWRVFMVQVATLLFNLGVNIFVIINMAMWEPKPVDLTKGGTLNYQGVGAAQWLMGIPLILGPIAVYLPFGLADQPFWGLVAVAAVGLAGIVFREPLLRLTVKRLLTNRYQMASNFRSETE